MFSTGAFESYIEGLVPDGAKDPSQWLKVRTVSAMLDIDSNSSFIVIRFDPGQTLVSSIVDTFYTSGDEETRKHLY
jgi:hypothetical protein